MKIQATKRPWSLCYVNHKCIGFGKQTQRGIATITEMVANTVFDKNVALTTKDFAISEANARLIVKAVNSHDSLMSAAKAFMTIKGSRANEYWDIEGNPTKELENLFEQSLKESEL